MNGSSRPTIQSMIATPLGRRQFVQLSVGASALTAVSMLAGCNTNNSQAASSGDADTSEASDSQGGYTGGATSYPVTFSLYDADGTAFDQTFDAAPSRAITLTDSLAEIMCRLGLVDRVVGTVAPEAPMPDDIAADYGTIPSLGDKKTVSQEALVAAEPEVLMGRAANFSAQKKSDAASYNDLGIKLYAQLASAQQAEPNLQGIIDDVKNIATLFDVQASASDYIDELGDHLQDINDKIAQHKDESAQSILIMTNYKGDTFGTFGGVSGASLQFNMLESMGATMASEESASGLTYENLIQFNPDVILYITAERNKDTDATVEDRLYQESSIAAVPAIENKKVVLIPYAEFMDASPRLFDSADKILDVLYQ